MSLQQSILAPFRQSVRHTTPVRHVGRITEISGSALQIKGLNNVARLGDEISIRRPGHPHTRAEITRVGSNDATAVPYGHLGGMQTQTPVILEGAPRAAPDDSWLGRVLDPFGAPMDGRPLVQGVEQRTLKGDIPAAHTRRPMGARLETGIGVLDTLLPLARGQRVGLFAGSGVGKSSLLGRLARQVDCDVCVVVLIGERGRELRDFIDNTLGKEGLKRAVVIAATSDMAPGVRRRAIDLGLAVAEHFRDAGNHVLFLADSITRFAEAHREVAAATGEAANMRGFPASLTHALAQICERTGPGPEGSGDITAIFSVLVAGSDMEEPVADILRGLLDGHIVLSRAIAERGRYPAVDVLKSVSRCLPDVASDDENAILQCARERLGTYERSELMIQSGLYDKGSSPEIDASITSYQRLDSFFGIQKRNSIPESYELLQACIS